MTDAFRMTDEHIVCLICNEDLEDKSSEATAKMIKNEYPVSSHLNLIDLSCKVFTKLY